MGYGVLGGGGGGGGGGTRGYRMGHVGLEGDSGGVRCRRGC